VPARCEDGRRRRRRTRSGRRGRRWRPRRSPASPRTTRRPERPSRLPRPRVRWAAAATRTRCGRPPPAVRAAPA